MMKKTIVMILALIMAFVSFSCKKKAQVKGVDLEVTFAESDLSDNLITDVELKWKTKADFERLRDHHVFVHFWHKNNLLLQDDHKPEPATSKWQPGSEYVYKRRIYIPPFIDEFDPRFKGKETLVLSVGFFSPYDRTGKSQLEVLNKRLDVFPPPLDTPEVIYESGWYDLEINPEAYLRQWRWTAKEAKCIIDNPHRDALLVIKGGLNKEVFKDQKVIFKINELILDEFIPEESAFERSYNVKKEMLGDKDEFYLIITTDKTFIPAQVAPDSRDERELGLQIAFIYFR